ncbi:YybH family protein [Roseivirga sp.]|uniref:YybH family protein n=1 Tax=Roseivirga sp. TaxID=1964215 RepID=UPI003B51763A
MKRILLSALIIPFLYSCGTPSTDPEAEKAAIAVASKAFSQAYMDGNLEEQMSYYTDDIVIMSGSREMIRGKEEVTNYWRLPASVKVLEHASTPVELEVSGDMAKDFGYYEGKSVRNGDTITFRGQYLITWRKEADGQWRMSADMWSALNN